MVCTKCGNNINEGEQRCSNCQYPINIVSYEFDSSISDILNNKVEDSGDSEKDNSESIKLNKKTNKKQNPIIFVVSIVAIVAVLLIVIKVYSDKRHQDYIKSRTVVFDEDVFWFGFVGADGYGNLNISVDPIGVYDYLMPALGYTEASIRTRPVMDEIYKNINVEVSEQTHLSNGQEITVNVTINESCLEEHNIYFEGQEIKLTVQGLKELKDVDFFEDLYIEIKENKDGTCSLKWHDFGKNSDIISKYLKCEPSGSLNYGDSFILTLEESAELIREEYGVNPVSLKKEYVLIKQDEKYLSDMSEVSDILMDRLVENDISRMSNGVIDSIKINECEYVGSFFYSFDNSGKLIESEHKNCLVNIYKATDYTYVGKELDTDAYVWNIYFDIVKDPYGGQFYNCEERDDGHPTISYNSETGKYDGVAIEDAMNYVKNKYNMQEEYISYNSKINDYFD